MKQRNQMAKKMALVGAGIGLALFALFGLLQGSVIGGAIGLDIVNSIYDPSRQLSLLARIIVGGSMLAGVIVSGIVFVVGCSSVCAAAGYLIGFLVEPRLSGEQYKESSKTS